MSSNRITPNWLAKLEEATHQYSLAFQRVHDQLGQTNTGRVPPWCFALDRMNIEDVAVLDPILARLEHDRRRWRVALHSLTEYIALRDIDDSVPMPKPQGNPDDNLDAGTLTQDLDRFITVLNRAKNGGVIYVNGTFEPVNMANSPTTKPPKK